MVQPTRQTAVHVCRSSPQQVDEGGGLEPDIALEDWNMAPREDAAAQA